MDIKAYETITKNLTAENACEIVSKLVEQAKKDVMSFSALSDKVTELEKKNNDLRDSNTYLVSHYVTGVPDKEEPHEKTVAEMTPDEALEDFKKMKGSI